MREKNAELLEEKMLNLLKKKKLVKFGRLLQAEVSAMHRLEEKGKADAVFSDGGRVFKGWVLRKG